MIGDGLSDVASARKQIGQPVVMERMDQAEDRGSESKTVSLL